MFHITRFLKKYNWLFLAGLLVIHFIVKDRLWITSAVFYATPLPVIIGLSVVCLYIERRGKKLSYAVGIVTLTLTAYWLVTSYRIQSGEYAPKKTMKIMLWNVAYIEEHPNPSLIRYINRISADIVGIVESGDITDHALEEYQSALRNYSIRRLDGDMLFLTKGKVHSVTYQKISFQNKYNDIEIELDEKIYHVVLSDIISNPFASRQKPIGIIFGVPKSDERVIIMGDFNTPYESVFFDDYKHSYYNAFHSAGSGFSETWPCGIPLLQLDHIWTSQDLKPLKVTKRYDFLSDHAMLEADFDAGD